MKTISSKYFFIFIFTAACVLMSSFAFAKKEGGNLDHEALAVQYENLAKEMQAKVEQQKDIFKHKPRTSYLGRNGPRIKKRITARIRKYEKAASENLAKAEYHLLIAASQEDRGLVSKPGRTDEQIDKAKKKFDSNQSL